MIQEVTMRQTSFAMEVPSMGGIGGFIMQPDVTVITTHTGVRIVVEGLKAEMRGNGWSLDLADETPDFLRDHAVIAGYWYGRAKGMADEARKIAEADLEDFI